jgi:hypothetical protein
MIYYALIVGMIFSEHQNLKSYTYTINYKEEIKSCKHAESILPNGDKITIPILNKKVPIIFIYEKQGNLCDLHFDYSDKKCNDYKDEKLISYQLESKETFSTIKKQINDIKIINSNSMSAVDGRIKDLSKKIEELNAMALEIKNSQIKTIDYFERLETNKDNKNSFNEIKYLISEVQKELVGIRQKIDTKVEIKPEPKVEIKPETKPEIKLDIIEPNLPILDKALTPSKK